MPGSFHRSCWLGTAVIAAMSWAPARADAAGRSEAGPWLVAAGGASATPSDAGPSLEAAYREAAAALDEVDLPGALRVLDEALAAAGDPRDPRRATLLAFKAGVLFASDGDEAATLSVLRDAVAIDPYVDVPIELRTAELQALLEQARAGTSMPPPAVRVTASEPRPGAPVDITVHLQLSVPPDASVVLYWRPAGGDVYEALSLARLGNVADGQLAPERHGDRDIEYFVGVYDAGHTPLAQTGEAAAPHRLRFPGAAGRKPTAAPREPSRADLPRWFLHLGAGFGFGMASGSVERTYRPMTPGTDAYGPAEQACAIERWAAGGGELSRDRAAVHARFGALQQADPTLLPLPVDVLADAYRPDACAERHTIRGRFAVAPFHLVPEVGVRLGSRVVLSVFSRLQVVTAANVRGAPDPAGRHADAFVQEARSAEPRGVTRGLVRPAFTFAVGAKVRAFLPSLHRRVRPFAGGFAGYGFARFRTPLSHSHDRNGNSVPDASETSISGVRSPDGSIPPETCVPVWPYNQACRTDAAGAFDRSLAAAVRDQTSASERRVDTVRLGPGFIGALVGVHIDLARHLALWAELDVGVWFPHNTSVLFDLSVGPVVTF